MISNLVSELNKLINQNKLFDAIEVSKKIINLKPSEFYYYYNHSVLAREAGLRDEVVLGLQLALERKPNDSVMHRMLADALFAVCRWQEAFKEAEWRFTWPLPDSPMPLAPMPAVLELMPRFRQLYNKPYWNGKDSLEDKTILIFNEAGHGDCIQNIRYARFLKAKHVILEVKEELHRVLTNCHGIDECIKVNHEQKRQAFFETFTDKCVGSPLPDHDYVVSVQTLPYYFDSNLENTLCEPYVFPQKTNRSIPKNDKIKIGICWAGNEKDYNDRHRSCWLRHFMPLSKLKNVQLFSLQKGKMKRTWICEPDPDMEVDLLDESEGISLVDMGKHFKDFNDTAEVMKCLDLVISVDTAIVHLAGAMGVPVWMINSHLRHDTRWELPWYNSVKVIYQPTPGDWLGLMQIIAGKLNGIHDWRQC